MKANTDLVLGHIVNLLFCQIAKIIFNGSKSGRGRKDGSLHSWV